MISLKNKAKTGIIIYLVSLVVFLTNPKAHIILVTLICSLELNRILRKLPKIEYLSLLITSILYMAISVYLYFQIYNKFGMSVAIFISTLLTLSDVFSYIAGTMFKKQEAKRSNFIYRILCYRPVSISPNKTLVGFLFAGLAGAFTVILFKFLRIMFVYKFQDMSFLHKITLVPSCFDYRVGFGLGICGQIGDLLESAIKRKSGVKDSGTILAAHGGFCDRYDSTYSTIYASYFLLVVNGYL